MNSTSFFSDDADGFKRASFRELAGELAKRGGEPRFLEFLLGLQQPPFTKPARPSHDPRYWAGRRSAILKLREELERFYPTISAEELDTLRTVADKMLLLEALHKVVPAALHGAVRGSPIKRPDLYFWFAALVPYTAFATGQTRWDWISRWLYLVTGVDKVLGKPQTYWKNVVQPKAQGKGLPLQLRVILLSGAGAYRQWLREGKPGSPRHAENTGSKEKITTAAELKKRLQIWKAPPTERERRYVEVVCRMLPALKEQLARRASQA